MTSIKYRYNGRDVGKQAWPERGIHQSDPDWPYKWPLAVAFMLFLAVMFGLALAYAKWPDVMRLPLDIGGACVLVGFFCVFMPAILVHLWRLKRFWNTQPGFKEWQAEHYPKADERREQNVYMVIILVILAIIGYVAATQ